MHCKQIKLSMGKVIRFSKDRNKNVAALAKELDWWYENVIVGNNELYSHCYRSDECWIPVGPKLYWDVLRNFEWYEEQLSNSTYRVREYGGDEPLYYYRQKAKLCFKFEPKR